MKRSTYQKLFFTVLLVGCLGLIFEISSGLTTVPDENENKEAEKPVFPPLSDLYLQGYSKDTSILNDLAYSSYYIPEYSDEVYAKRIKKIKSSIPLTYNKFVKAYINLYLYKKRTLVTKVIGRSYDYFPVFEQVLKDKSMPLELKNLAIVESALNTDARSWCGALGIWQFMPQTGRIYKLKIDSLVDERKDVQLSTQAATAFLNNLYNQYHDWYLAIAAYNCGSGNVNKAIKKVRRHRGRRADFWAIKPYLPKETQGYVPAFIAACYMMNYYYDHNLRAINPQFLQCEIKPVEVKNFLTFEEISKNLGITPEELVYFNPELEQYKRVEVKDTVVSLNLPVLLHEKFYKSEDNMYRNCESILGSISSDIKSNP